ncbi:MAG: type II toxin-antitoxin system PemK/MazF family toxin [Nitrospirales bacterium]
MKRGDLVIVSAPGNYGKPRPAVIIQSDIFNETHASILVCLITSDQQDAPLFRIDVQPTEETGLKVASQIMIDKIVALRRERIAQHIGQINDETLIRLNRSLALFIGLAS